MKAVFKNPRFWASCSNLLLFRSIILTLEFFILIVRILPFYCYHSSVRVYYRKARKTGKTTKVAKVVRVAWGKKVKNPWKVPELFKGHAGQSRSYPVKVCCSPTLRYWTEVTIFVPFAKHRWNKNYLQDACSNWRVFKNIGEISLFSELWRRVVEILDVDPNTQSASAGRIPSISRHNLQKENNSIYSLVRKSAFNF